MYKLFRFSPKRALLAAFVLLLSIQPSRQNLALAQSSVVWSDIAENAIANRSNREIVPQHYRTFSLNTSELKSLFAKAPRERSPEASSRRVVLNIPYPDGTSSDFQIFESPIMAPELSAKYPELKTYIGQGIDDRAATARFDWTQFGFHAIIFTERGTIYIDPYNRSTTTHYISYFKRDLLPDPARILPEIGPLGTESASAMEVKRIVASGAVPRSTGEQLRTYRLALAATGEYTIYHGGTKAAGMAAIVTAMNRVNGVYEREVSVRMVLIANNDTLVYTNPNTDPYTNNNGSTMLGQNQSNLDQVIGTNNYDVGHVFSTGGGGVAYLAVICVGGFKARGVTGLSAPIGDPFYIDYVAHEMGHQFGGNHSFNGNAGSCGGGNRNASTAYEPGSGSTIMAYAGICSPQNLQSNSDDYFHGISLDEIIAHTQIGSGNSCAVITNTGNTPPFVNAGGSVVYTIPLSTPFVLTGSGSDPNNDPLTYCWEEFDLGPAGHPNSPSGDAPIFRSFLPTSSPSRMFPKLSDLIANVQTIGEILPSYARIMAFRLTARDNRAGGGGNSNDLTSVVVTGGAGPFQVTYPNTAVTWIANSTDSVTWNVANTTGPPINCTMVNIRLSTDGGQTFPIMLASNTPNDGREVITVPTNITNTARIKVESVGNIFFDMSNAHFSILPFAAPTLVYPVNAATGLPSSFSLRWNYIPLATFYHVQVALSPSFIFNVIVNDTSITDTTRALTGLNPGTLHYWRVRARNNEATSPYSEVRTFTTLGVPAQVSLVSPAHQAILSTDSVTFSWNGQPFADRYWLEHSMDSTFASSVIDSTLTDTAITVHQLQVNQTYWWRVKAHNSLGWGPYSVTRSFTIISTFVQSAGSIPERFSLEQNYPNPFNPSTTIEFSVPHVSEVIVEIFNTLGERMTTLVEGELGPGTYRTVWNAQGYPSGVYYFRMSAGGFVQARKLLLLK
jgi:hypothetical protein